MILIKTTLGCFYLSLSAFSDSALLNFKVDM